jgi:hypothetical protein
VFVPPGKAWYCKLRYSRSARVLRWRVGSWQRLANMCRSSFSYSVQLPFTFSRTGGLVPAWWASECLAKELTSHHASNSILPVGLSGAWTLELERERRFLPYRSFYDSMEDVSSVKAFPPLRSGQQIQYQRIVRRCKRRDSEHVAHHLNIGPGGS